jgi:hypothetical protein
LTPLFLAFPDIYTSGMMYMDQSMNVMFLVDIILNFFTAFFDEDYMIINDIKVSFTFGEYFRKLQ